METFSLYEGSVTLTEDKILVQGDRAVRNRQRTFGLLACSGVYFFIEVVSDLFRYHQLESPQLLGFYIHLCLFLIWIPAFYFSYLKVSVSNEIPINAIKKMTHNISSRTGYPIVRIHLHNGVIRDLQFGSLYDLDFVRHLKQQGININ